VWGVGHVYEGLWKESQMDGIGELKHVNGRVFNGFFKRNYFLKVYH
jgi:hypothetical protein